MNAIVVAIVADQADDVRLEFIVAGWISKQFRPRCLEPSRVVDVWSRLTLFAQFWLRVPNAVEREPA